MAPGTSAASVATVPLGWNSNTFPAADPSCKDHWQDATAPVGCRFSAAAKGFVSLHPGGANFGFADGSVRFLRDSINTWPFNPATGYPVGVSESNGVFTMAAGTQFGVYQKLTTRAGGEVVSSDAY